MKRKLVGTAVGRALLRLSHFSALKMIPLSNPENAAVIANDIIADLLVANICPKGGTFVDVGAHIGSVFSTVHHADTSVRIIAFEADPVKARALAARFPYCTLHPFAVGEISEDTTFYLDPAASGYNSLIKHHSARQVEISVTVKRLDDILAGQPADVIKIDIEGAELGALRGGQTLIAAQKPVIMFESTRDGPNTLGYSPQLVWEWFQTMEYEVFTPDRVAHDAPALSLSTFLDGHLCPMRTHNYFAIHKDKRTAVRDRARAVLNVRPDTN